MGLPQNLPTPHSASNHLAHADMPLQQAKCAFIYVEQILKVHVHPNAKIQSTEKQRRQEEKLTLPNVGLPFPLLLQLSPHHHHHRFHTPSPGLSCRKGGRMHLCRTLVRCQQGWRLINTFFQNPMALPIPTRKGSGWSQ